MLSSAVHQAPDLVSRVRDGESAALTELYDAHAESLFALARRLTGSSMDAEDVLHDVFVRLPESLKRYEERGQFAAWLKRVTARTALDHVRARTRRREVTLPESRPVDTRAFNPADLLALEHAIATLPDHQRAVVVLFAIEGYSHEEVGLMLGITAGASKVRLSRALEKLRLLLGGRE